MTDADDIDIGSVADELYGLDPGEFTTVRDRRAAEARTAGDRPLATAIKALRRPTMGMWALNLLARTHPEELERLAALGSALRQAHAKLDPVQLRELGLQRRTVVTSLVAQARTLINERDRKLSEAAVREIDHTLEAALAEDQAATAVRAGRLSRPLENEGLSPFASGGAEPGPPPVVNVDGTVDAPPATPLAPWPEEPAIEDDDGDTDAARAAELGALAEARTTRDRAEDLAVRAEDDATAAGRMSAEAHRDEDEAAAELARLNEAVDVARRRHDQAVAVTVRADRERQQAAARAAEARRRAQAAARRLSDLDGDR